MAQFDGIKSEVPTRTMINAIKAYYKNLTI